jgi:hypothetical protein
MVSDDPMYTVGSGKQKGESFILRKETRGVLQLKGVVELAAQAKAVEVRAIERQRPGDPASPSSKSMYTVGSGKQKGESFILRKETRGHLAFGAL